MAAIKRILVPVDFSPASIAALRYACDLADGLKASLCLFHVTEIPLTVYGYLDESRFFLPPDYLATLERNGREHLDRLLTPEQKEKYQATFVHRTGMPAQELLGYLNEHAGIDLIVMATHGRGGVARLMMGSVADKVVRAAPCPVLTIRGPGEAKDAGVTRAA